MARTTTNPLNDQLKILLPKEEKEAFVAACAANETTISIQLRKFIRDYVDKCKK